MENIGRLENLLTLRFGRGSQVTDESLFHLGPLPNLQQLDLSFSAVTDEGMASVVRFAKLERLDLACTKVTPTGLLNLAALQNLKSVWLSERMGDMQPVFEAMPNCAFMSYNGDLRTLGASNLAEDADTPTDPGEAGAGEEGPRGGRQSG